MTKISRLHGRAYNEMRAINISYDVYGYGAASVLFELGKTIVQCSVNVHQGVPPFLKGKKTGWLKAEYAMLPSATHQRTQRESSSAERNGRSVEISRLISRCLRTMVDLTALGEHTIVVDCDVLQADGGTRTACITAASLALHKAAERWVRNGQFTGSVVHDAIAAVSVGILSGSPLLDIDFAEDSSLDADFNFVLTKNGAIVEIQGSSEKKAVSFEQFNQITQLAVSGTQQLLALYQSSDNKTEQQPKVETKAPLFSLQNRLNTAS